ncbi:uncharacterized protein C16orf46 homolog isoform X2 [Rhinatrema bivittatum]|uniref:uncharacterized protein C16orf46 homolog isoform X2 n=1 Tax=Rhinatrema bivittatum TaxID=194408 RepID=UPI0011276B46|nr:uncharacterized protein C16orf46 homolog isoform X2 [Rhinatrema bivittatum]XP_029464007.1 uncharacterized protein C16orf46 homolog isoform X2 [Rhinatrema bivittatum]XP_029464008.1 uncharacterized protein C16orf46 homolog isoform X2 [Rhinatrema bivittatum]
MESCNEKELVLEKNENQQEVVQWRNSNLNETGRNLVFSLLRISEKNSEEDENSMEYVIGTGWEGAVQGWGRTSPFACLQPPKKPRKAKLGETVNSCLLCLDLLQAMDKNVTLETKATAQQSKPAGKLPAATPASSSQEEVSAEGPPVEHSKSISCLGGSKKDTVVQKLCTSHASQGEQKQAKEYAVWFQEKLKNTVNTASLASREMKKGFNLDSTMLSSGIGSESEESLLLNTFLVLPPVGSAVCNDPSDVSVRKNKGIVIQQQERGHSRALMENPSSCNTSKKPEPQSERGSADKRTDLLLSKEIKIQETVPVFAATIPRPPMLRENEYFYWQCSFVPKKTSPTPLNAVTSKQNDPLAMKLLQGRTVQTRQNGRLDEPKPHCSHSIRNETKARLKTKKVSHSTSVLSHTDLD